MICHLNILIFSKVIRYTKSFSLTHELNIDDRFISNLTIESNAAFDIIINAQPMQWCMNW